MTHLWYFTYTNAKVGSLKKGNARTCEGARREQQLPHLPVHLQPTITIMIHFQPSPSSISNHHHYQFPTIIVINSQPSSSQIFFSLRSHVTFNRISSPWLQPNTGRRFVKTPPANHGMTSGPLSVDHSQDDP